MTRYGVIADVHGNLEALESALALLDGAGIDRLLCLGDVVGFNADSEACLEALRRRGAAIIAGNHDLIVAGALSEADCWYEAAHALRRTREALGEATAERLRALPRALCLEQGALLLIHGGLGDPTRYLRTVDDIRHEARRVRRAHPDALICLHGHTHEPVAFEVDPVDGAVEALGTESIDLYGVEPGRLLMINPGSVDAARKPRGQYGSWAQLMVLDTGAMRASFLGALYDSSLSERKARLAGYRLDWLRQLEQESRARLDEASWLLGRALRRIPLVGRMMSRRCADAAPAAAASSQRYT